MKIANVFLESLVKTNRSCTACCVLHCLCDGWPLIAMVFQVELKEYVKLKDSIYEVDPKEEECFRFSRVLNFKV